MLKILLMAFVIGSWSLPAAAQEARIKDLTTIVGNRSNSLIGIGLVIGLNGTGDSAKSIVTNKAAANMLSRLGLHAESGEVITQSLAAVIVTAELPPFARNGDRIDVKASIVGDAKSLAGGTLILTPLRAGDGEIYAVAQGPVLVGRASGTAEQSHTVVEVSQGGVIERDFSPPIVRGDSLQLSLREADFTTSARIAQVINQHFRGFHAEAVDSSQVKVRIPPRFADKLVEFVAEIEQLRVAADIKAVVVIDERTGTVVMGAEVRVAPVTVAHGDLAISVGEGRDAKQASLVDVDGTTVGTLVQSLNAMGVKPKDLISILRSINRAGALRAELRVM